MAHKIKDIAAALGVAPQGDGELTVSGLAEPAMAAPDELALASNPAYAETLAHGAARAALLWDGADWQGLGLAAAICVGRPRYAMAALTRLYDAAWEAAGAPSQHPTAVIAPDAAVEAVALGPYTVIGPGVVIEAGARIGSHVSIGAGTRIGADAFIRDGVRITHGVRIGARVVIQPGAVLGGDGFSFVTPEPSSAETVRETLGKESEAAQQPWARIHSLGGVEIGDDVEIGAGSSIDRGTIRATRIGTGTKIDSLVQVGHNAEIGQHCLLCGQVGIAGSAKIGDFVILGGQSGVVDNISIGDRVVTGAGTLCMSNVPAGRVMLGSPATQMTASIESYKALRRLPRDLAALKKAVSKLRGSD
ncbi:MAG: UDP-3-O-(3-hydroxymyristoyl)glucosamine N-acyltransferase [Pseudomonadota bacterium]